MKTYQITFCFHRYDPQRIQSQTVKAINEKEALTALYLHHWGTNVFVLSITCQTAV